MAKSLNRSSIQLILLLIVALLNEPLYAQSWAAKMFSTTTHDFGSVSRNAKTEYKFEFENVYEEDVHIASIRSSCGCTTAKALKPTIKSWEKGEIIAEFNTRSFIGSKTAAITVVFDRPYYAELQLLVMGNIRSDIVTEPGQVEFGAVPLGEQKNQLVKISYAGRNDWAIKDVRGNNSNLQVRIRNAERRGNQTNYLLEVRLLESAPAGSVQDELVIVTNDPVNESFTIPVSGRISAPLEIAPAIVDLGPVKLDEVAQQRFVVKGSQPFEIKDVRAADGRLKFAHGSGKKLVHVVTVQAAADDKVKDDIDCNIEVVSDLASANVTGCRIVGQVR